jgi:hypothetical protein
MMDHAPINFTHDHSFFHQQYFDPTDYDLFVVATRDPMSRAISAFNWRHPSGGGIETARSPAEIEMYDCFPELPGGVNHFAESLDDDSACGEAARRCLHSPSADCNHLGWRAQFYLSTGLGDREKDLLGHLRSMNATKVAGEPPSVFMAGLDDGTENQGIAGTTSELWDWLCLPQETQVEEAENLRDYPRHTDTSLSPKGQELLRKHLVGDYFAIQELRKYAVQR